MRIHVDNAGSEMNNFFLLVIGVLFILLAAFLVFYFQTQQNFQDIAKKLEEIQHPPKRSRHSDTLKRTLASFHDKLVVLEADLAKTPRESLTEEEIKTFDVSRHQIKTSIAGLKANGDWVGMPFEYEWAEMLDRLPILLALYRKAEAEKTALEMTPDNELALNNQSEKISANSPSA